MAWEIVHKEKETSRQLFKTRQYKIAKEYRQNFINSGILKTGKIVIKPLSGKLAKERFTK